MRQFLTFDFAGFRTRRQSNGRGRMRQQQSQHCPGTAAHDHDAAASAASSPSCFAGIVGSGGDVVVRIFIACAHPAVVRPVTCVVH